MSDITRFDIPVRKDRYGAVEMKPVLVQDKLLPLMAEIIDAASRPGVLREQYMTTPRRSLFAEDQWEALRKRIRYDLEHGLRESAKKLGQTLITAVKFEEHGDEQGVLFTAQAVAMRLIVPPEGTEL